MCFLEGCKEIKGKLGHGLKIFSKAFNLFVFSKDAIAEQLGGKLDRDLKIFSKAFRGSTSSAPEMFIQFLLNFLLCSVSAFHV